MRIGYACLTVGVPNTNQRSCIQKNANNENLIEIIQHNLSALENIIHYNINNNIKLFRISSDLVPFASSPVNSVLWWDLFDSQFKSLGHTIVTSGMRVSMHPGQYTVLNSPDEGIVMRSILDLNYHAQVLDSMGLNREHKIILHIGGVYHDKNSAMERFCENYKQLTDQVKKRLIIENDDKSYDISDVLDIGTKLSIPVVFDNLHHAVNPHHPDGTDVYWINKCRSTWQENDGVQKIHYSQQDLMKKAGSHSNSIRIDEFVGFYEKLEREDLDIMLEVKDKNLSAIKCIHCTSPDTKRQHLEVEWSHYKYKVLENSQAMYIQIRKLLQDKDNCRAIPFYRLIEEALQCESKTGDSVNAAMHVWGYFKHRASETEKGKFTKALAAFQKGEMPLRLIKNNLWRLAVKYQQAYLLDSYYFV